MLDPNGEKSIFSTAFDINTETTKLSYKEKFLDFVSNLYLILEKDVAKDLKKVVTKMQDNTPCPASHVVVGSLSVAGLGLTDLHDLLANKELRSKGSFLVMKIRDSINQKGHIVGNS